jgi:hypothetical protein
MKHRPAANLASGTQKNHLPVPPPGPVPTAGIDRRPENNFPTINKETWKFLAIAGLQVIFFAGALHEES